MKFEQYKFLKKQLLQKACQQNLPEQKPQASPLVLAYLGDALFSCYVRQQLILLEPNKVRVLNDVGAQLVSAVMQAQALDYLQPGLSEQEAEVVRRGRNTKSSIPKSASMQEYRKSTGFECLLGWLFWQGEEERLAALMQQAFIHLAALLLKKENGGLA